MGKPDHTERRGSAASIRAALDEADLHESSALEASTQRVRPGNDAQDSSRRQESLHQLVESNRLPHKQGSHINNSDAPTLASHTGTPDPKPDTIGGRYNVNSEIGRGGMGRVWLATDGSLGRSVALKEMLSRRSSKGGKKRAQLSDLSAMQRFLREARITGRLEHPGIIPVYEVGENEDGSAFYTMRYVKGRSLADELRSIREAKWANERASLHERLKLIDNLIAVCDALAYAHSRGVIHRDLKPDNVMLGDYGETLVLDWGLAKVTANADFEVAADRLDPSENGVDTRIMVNSASLAPTDDDDWTEADRDSNTLAGTVLGTPAYMPPEQAAGKLREVDERADVYALGAILYEILAGKPPYSSSDSGTIVEKVLTTPPRPILELEPAAPPELVRLCESAMERKLEERLSQVMSLSNELRAYRDGRSLTLYHYTWREQMKRWSKRNKRSLVVAGIALFIVAGIAGIAVVNSERTRQRYEEDGRLKAERAEQAREAEVARLRMERVAELEARLAAINARDPEATLAKAQEFTERLSHKDLQGPWSTLAAIQRTNDLTSPGFRTDVIEILSELSEIARMQLGLLDQASERVRGYLVKAESVGDLDQLRQSVIKTKLSAAKLAMLAAEYAVARTELSASIIPNDDHERFTSELARAQEALSDAWVDIAMGAIDDMELGRSRDKREVTFRSRYGFMPLDPEGYVRKLIGLRHPQVAEALVERLQPYTEKVKQSQESITWSDSERDALYVLLYSLGEIGSTQLAVPALSEFFHYSRDELIVDNIQVIAGRALCSTNSYGALQAISTYFEYNFTSQVWLQLETHARRLRTAIPDTEPTEWEDWYKRAWQFETTGDTDSAIQCMRHATKIAQQDKQEFLFSKLADLASHGKAWEESLEAHEVVMEMNNGVAPSPRFLASYASVVFHMKQFDRALRLYREVLAIDPKETYALHNGSVCLFELELYDEAVEWSTREIELQPKEASAYINRAAGYAGLRLFHKALDDLSRSISLDSSISVAWLRRGHARSQLGEYQSALDDFRIAIRLDPRDAHIYYHRALALTQLDRPQEALNDLNTALEIDPLFFDALCARTMAFLNAGQAERALEDGEILVATEPHNTRSYSIIGDCYRTLNDYNKALEAYDQALELFERNNSALWGKAIVQARTGSFERAIATLDLALSFEVEKTPGWQQLKQARDQFEYAKNTIENWVDYDATSIEELLRVSLANSIHAYWLDIWGEHDKGLDAVRKAPTSWASAEMERAASGQQEDVAFLQSVEGELEARLELYHAVYDQYYLNLIQYQRRPDGVLSIIMATLVGRMLMLDDALIIPHLMPENMRPSTLPTDRSELMDLGFELMVRAASEGFRDTNFVHGEGDLQPFREDKRWNGILRRMGVKPLRELQPSEED